MINFTIDGRQVEAEAGKTVLEAALASDIYIPNLCYHPDLRPVGSCRICVVEIEGMRGLPPACTTEIKEGMVVSTSTEQLQRFRRNLVWLILSEQTKSIKENSQLEKVVDWVGASDLLPGFKPAPKNLPILSDDPLYQRDPSMCILCGRCVRMCQDVRGVGGIGIINRGTESVVATSYDESLREVDCRFCGACVEVCPTGALSDKSGYRAADKEHELVPCKHECPAGIDIPRFIRFIAEERFQDAVDVIRERVPFPFTLGCICPHDCETVCRRCDVDEPIAIRELKRFVADIDSGSWRPRLQIGPDTGKKVAIIGSGPAGLTCAWFLRKQGHAVTVYDSAEKAGGTMRSSIPRYRLTEEVLDQEIKYIEDIGVKMAMNRRIESLDELYKEGADAVFLAVGATKGMTMGIPGEEGERIRDGIALLQQINKGEEIDLGKTVAVAGGGNVAMDVARTAVRLGAEKVVVLYRRTRAEMPASEEEVEYAIDEGVKMEFLVNPQAVKARGDAIEIECIRMELGESDASGRRRPIPIEGSEFSMGADSMVMAIGQQPTVPEKCGLATDKRGRLTVDDSTLAASKRGVFAGGDVVSGAATVVEAVDAGRTAAVAIDKYLGGTGDIFQPLAPEVDKSGKLGVDKGFGFRTRAATPVSDVKMRTKDFSEVESTFDAETAVAEARRCLRCQLRFSISSVPLPPDD